jgi:hypothetical protein
MGYAGNPQHTAVSSTAVDSLFRINWSTPVDQMPNFVGEDLYTHYGSPIITPGNTVIVPVKLGKTDNFELNAFNGATGAPKWTATTTYTLPPYSFPSTWTQPYGPTLTPTNTLYYAGPGGTVYKQSSPDSSSPPAPTQLAFYGLNNYNDDPNGFGQTVAISTPITSDSAGNIYFGFQVTGTSPLSPTLSSGIARIAANGTGTFVTAAAAAGGDSSMTQVAKSCAPALSPDGQHLYITVSNGSTGDLVELNSTTLAAQNQVALKDVKAGTNALVDDSSTATPMVGPDGDVYYGVLESSLGTNNFRGYMLHFSSDLQTSKTPGAFGWDDTASVVPASMVPSYHGSSSYLIMTKYNNYAGLGSGDGLNKLAILDPNNTETDPVTGEPVMKEVLTVLGQTPDPEFDGTFPGAVREWCINTAVVDPQTDSILANSEDGSLYRWDLTTGTLSEVLPLTSATGEAYTPTVVGPDGTVYAINNSQLFAVVPEPGTAAIVLAGSVLILRRRRRQTPVA